MAEAAVVDTTVVATDETASAATTSASATTTTDKSAAATTVATDAATVATDKTAATDSGAAKGYWPDDWQKRIAGDDEKMLKQVSRYQSPEEIWKKARSLEQRLSSGELKPMLPKDAKPEELAAWRKDNGIPETPDKYELKDIKVPEAEKDAIGAFLKDAHTANLTPDQAKAAVGSYLNLRAQAERQRQELDETQRLEAIDALASEWGGQFSRNKNLVSNVLAKFPESVREAFLSARLPDGRAIFNSPDIVKAFVSLELMNNPSGVVVGAGGGDLGKSMVDRYQEIQKIMREDRNRYNKDDALQTEHRSIIGGLMKHGMMNENGQLIKAA